MRRLDAYLKFKAPSADMETRGAYAARGVNQRDEYRINSVIAPSETTTVTGRRDWKRSGGKPCTLGFTPS